MISELFREPCEWLTADAQRQRSFALWLRSQGSIRGLRKYDVDTIIQCFEEPGVFTFAVLEELNDRLIAERIGACSDGDSELVMKMSVAATTYRRSLQ
jgi:hypothetical protein